MAFAGEAGAAGTTGAGSVAGPIVVIALSVGWISWNLWRRFSGPSDPGEGGEPCGQNTTAGQSMSTTKRSVKVRTILGAMVSWDMALSEAQGACASLAANCSSNCLGGKVV